MTLERPQTRIARVLNRALPRCILVFVSKSASVPGRSRYGAARGTFSFSSQTGPHGTNASTESGLGRGMRNPCSVLPPARKAAEGTHSPPSSIDPTRRLKNKDGLLEVNKLMDTSVWCLPTSTPSGRCDVSTRHKREGTHAEESCTVNPQVPDLVPGGTFLSLFGVT